MKFANSYWLYLIPVALLALYALFAYNKRARRLSIQAFASPRLLASLMASFSVKKQRIKYLLFSLSIILLLLSLARPQWGHRWEDQQSRGIDILIALDVSKSMLAEDVRPNRLERSKYAILDLMKKLHGDRLGLIAFAGNAFLQCPLTLDYNAFTQSIEAASPSSIYRGGTDIGRAIRTAELAFTKEHNYKFLILITDGEDLESKGVTQAAEAAKDDLTLYCVGVGSDTGELIPIKNSNGSVDYLRDADGKIVKTKLDSSTLKKISSATGGFYVPLGPTGEGLEKVYEAGLSTIPERDFTSKLRKVPIEQYQWPLGLAILLLITEWILSTKRKKTQTSRRSISAYKPNIKNAASWLFICGLATLLLTKKAEGGTAKGYEAFEKGDFKQSQQHYEKAIQASPNQSDLLYNLGTATYKNEAYEQAGHYFSQSLTIDDPSKQQNIFYNLGNTRYRQGELSLHTNPEETIELWEESIKHYQSALDLYSGDQEAQENYTFVQKKLEDLKQQEQEDKKKKEEQEKKDQKENSQDNSEDNADSEDDVEPQKENPENPSEDNHRNKQPSSEDSSPSQKQETPSQAPLPNSEQKLSLEEARQILNTMQGSEKKLPLMGSEKDNHSLGDNTIIKDW